MSAVHFSCAGCDASGGKPVRQDLCISVVPAVHVAVSAVDFVVPVMHFAVSSVHFAVSAVHFSCVCSAF